MTNDELQKVLSQPTASIIKAGAALGMSKNTVYEMSKSGQMPLVGFGKKRRVPTAWLRRQLMLDEAS